MQGRKGKELSYEELIKLPLGTKIWVEYDQSKWNLNVESSVGTICNDSYGLYTKKVNGYDSCSLSKNNINRYNMKYYEWIEEELELAKESKIKTDYKIGDKVVPRSKTVKGYSMKDVNLEPNWKYAQKINQPYLFVAGIDKIKSEEQKVLILNEDKNSFGGSYYNFSDVTLYIEPEQMPQPTTVYLILDTSGSTHSNLKDTYIKLYEKLIKEYKTVHVISHSTIAKFIDINELSFSGGSYISSGLSLAIGEVICNTDNCKIIQLSDGDNWSEDNERYLKCLETLNELNIPYEYYELFPTVCSTTIYGKYKSKIPAAYKLKSIEEISKVLLKEDEIKVDTIKEQTKQEITETNEELKNLYDNFVKILRENKFEMYCSNGIVKIQKFIDKSTVKKQQIKENSIVEIIGEETGSLKGLKGKVLAKYINDEALVQIDIYNNNLVNVVFKTDLLKVVEEEKKIINQSEEDYFFNYSDSETGLDIGIQIKGNKVTARIYDDKGEVLGKGSCECPEDTKFDEDFGTDLAVLKAKENYYSRLAKDMVRKANKK